MENVIAAAIVIVIVALAARYIYVAKKSGKKCIGCPDGARYRFRNLRIRGFASKR
jgi:hypothetical protein